ncbi:MAG TPA: aminotransferase class I/II-fold pyridoxal phosphate-dependent enzyme [Bacillota bacterium]|nr:aminotransferase class I/II-fold pyridoxal phosphate-dependent enzyme [Bacillota bacterium]HPF41961.1 aminotransferase class I/II-fold pyridoxal phosphate-dependent enzyme [Bacillota bacterium]HPJ85566.1 aminotransferase class I/II-fold pyridoxal phosphate-dependent enzyme [Bacillota bacterium]HPQ61482.1 aminotransferase class I/II-fold pyridoxal phosphate-dependent enzyme [Bacillota bacterium]HRX92016.1 aminotransferase class I/II-fold pyridoxal phosphate-dependent enzyme [Candidatus Izemop
MDLFKKCFEFTTVDDYKKIGVYPYFHALDSKQDIVVTMEGKRRIMIGSNNYLGLTGDPRVIEAGVKALKEFGSGVSGSRFLNGTLTSHVELETELARFLNKEACVTFSTGFQTNLGIISAIAGRNDLIVCDRENHASIYDGARLSYAKMVRFHHNDMEDLEKCLQSATEDQGILIVTDGVFSMSGDICNLPEIVRLAKKYGARVMVDDAHGFGVLGKRGRGTAEYFGLEKEVDIIMGTFSKSLASLGGYMVGDEKIVEYVKHKSRPFIFCAAITPTSVATALEALRILESEPERPKALLDIAAYVRKGLIANGIKIMENSIAPIIPIYTYSMLRTLIACKLLYERGVYVNPVLPPAAPEGECLIRTSYTATHTEALMDEAIEIIADVLNNLPESDEELMKEYVKNE